MNKLKSDESKNMKKKEDDCKVGEQERLMPITNVIRIMRKMVPPHAKILDDAKETVMECVSEFIGFVTGEANDHSQHEQRKTVTADDTLYAKNKLGFDSYVLPLSLFLHRYRHLDLPTPPNRSAAYLTQPSLPFNSSYHNNG